MVILVGANKIKEMIKACDFMSIKILSSKEEPSTLCA